MGNEDLKWSTMVPKPRFSSARGGVFCFAGIQGNKAFQDR